MNFRRISAATVLVVDDQHSLRLLMCRTLENGGFHVLSASNGADALTLYRGVEHAVDLLVTDYSMPGMTGLELARKCCTLDEKLSVLYVSGSMPSDGLRAELEAARRGFLAKPFRQSELLRSARAVLAMEPVTTPFRQNHGARLERWSVER